MLKSASFRPSGPEYGERNNTRENIVNKANNAGGQSSKSLPMHLHVVTTAVSAEKPQLPTSSSITRLQASGAVRSLPTDFGSLL